MSDKRLQKIIIMLLCLVMIRGLIYGLLIPFDRSPDEYHHFKLIKAKQLQLNHTSEDEEQHIMAQMGLIRYYLLHPEARPEKYSLQDFAGKRLPKPPSSFHQIYYLTTAWILKILSLDDIRDEIYIIRGFSILCGAIIVFLSFLVTREVFPENFFMLVGVPLFIAFIPQFAAMNGAISDDKFAEVFTSLLFWIMVKIFKYGMRPGYFLIYFLAMALALLSKRTTMFTLPVLLVFAVVYYWKMSLGMRMHLVLLIVFIGAAIGGNYLAWWSDNMTRFTLSASSFRKLKNEKIPDNLLERLKILEDEKFTEDDLPDAVETQIGKEHADKYKKLILKYADKKDFFLNRYIIWLPSHKRRFLFDYGFSPESLKYYAKFFTVIYWSFWGVFGYMTIHLHHFWYMATAFVQFLSIGGVLKFVWQVKKKKILCEGWQSKTLYMFMMSIIFVILLIFLRSITYRPVNPMLAQGRRLFPVIIPISVLTMFGLENLIPLKHQRLIGVLGFIGVVILDVVCLSNYILLNFHLLSFF